MHEALILKSPDGKGIPGESTVYRMMKQIGITHAGIFYSAAE